MSCGAVVLFRAKPETTRIDEVVVKKRCCALPVSQYLLLWTETTGMKRHLQTRSDVLGVYAHIMKNKG
ncbi:hypothetical protein E4U43_003205 [Claviceps pusilla]|uniref:Uncharacterized protein n=1 Tax=Claviceps pusilla TaxID=123648 RepID=A0A9P7N6C7_9HYPO|nr:hypothetical protein E4U43_003205 [Claviceps pusilla]